MNAELLLTSVARKVYLRAGNIHLEAGEGTEAVVVLAGSAVVFSPRQMGSLLQSVKFSFKSKESIASPLTS